MDACTGADLICFIAGWLSQNVGITIVITISVILAWQGGYSSGKSDNDCNKTYKDGFINGVYYHAKLKKTIDINDCDEYMKEVLALVSKGLAPRKPPPEKK